MSARQRQTAKRPARGRARGSAAASRGDTRVRLVDAALHLLEEGGYAAASVQAIADRVAIIDRGRELATGIVAAAERRVKRVGSGKTDGAAREN